MQKIYVEEWFGEKEIDLGSGLAQDVLAVIETSGNYFNDDVLVCGVSPYDEALGNDNWCIGWDTSCEIITSCVIIAVHMDGKTYFDDEHIEQYIYEYLA